MKITTAQLKWLNWLRERGGRGYVDRYGRIVANGDVSPYGAQTTFLKLLSYGFLAGGGGYISVRSNANEILKFIERLDEDR